MQQTRIDHTPRRIRVRLENTTVADSVGARLVYAAGRHPEYAFAPTDVEWSGLAVGDADHRDELLGEYRSIRSAGSGETVGRIYTSGPAEQLVQFEFAAMDAWFEEDEQIWFHARDPFRRVDVLESSRHVEIAVEGRVVATTDRPRLVAETGLPARWYIPRADVDWSVLAPSETESACQYKGIATWFHLDATDHDRLADLAWGYERPIVEASKLTGLVAFYAEHASVETYVDGVAQHKPQFEIGWLNPSLDIGEVALAPA